MRVFIFLAFCFANVGYAESIRSGVALNDYANLGVQGRLFIEAHRMLIDQGYLLDTFADKSQSGHSFTIVFVYRLKREDQLTVAQRMTIEGMELNSGESSPIEIPPQLLSVEVTDLGVQHVP